MSKGRHTQARQSLWDSGPEHTDRRTPTSSGAVRAWTVNDLISVCKRLGIAYRESDVFTNFRGVVVTSGSTSILSVRAGLSDQEKVAVLAHELAHVALGHDGSPAHFLWYKPPTNESATEKLQEEEASAWAATLLVQPEVWDDCLSIASLEFTDASKAEAEAIRCTADRLNIPTDTVAFWRRHQHWSFPQEPSIWAFPDGRDSDNASSEDTSEDCAPFLVVAE